MICAVCDRTIPRHHWAHHPHQPECDHRDCGCHYPCHPHCCWECNPEKAAG